MNEHDGFAVIATDKDEPGSYHGGHLSQFRYSNSNREQNVILNYEFGQNAEAQFHDDVSTILDVLQEKFHESVNVKDEAWAKTADEGGDYQKNWKKLCAQPTREEIEDIVKYCNKSHHGLYFAGDSWAFCTQWQEGAMYTALHAVYRIMNEHTNNPHYQEPDPFQYIFLLK